MLVDEKKIQYFNFKQEIFTNVKLTKTAVPALKMVHLLHLPEYFDKKLEELSMMNHLLWSFECFDKNLKKLGMMVFHWYGRLVVM